MLPERLLLANQYVEIYVATQSPYYIKGTFLGVPTQLSFIRVITCARRNAREHKKYIARDQDKTDAFIYNMGFVTDRA